MLPNAHQRSESISLEAGTLLRCEHSWAVPNAWMPFPWSGSSGFPERTSRCIGWGERSHDEGIRVKVRVVDGGRLLTIRRSA